MTARFVNLDTHTVEEVCVRDARGRRGITVQSRFWGKVDRRGQNDCWPWLGCVRGGYGAFQLNGTNKRASRVAWEMHNGPVPSGLVVMHRCDNSLCVNPIHLAVGSQHDNILDMLSKGRAHYQKMTHCKRGHLLTEDNRYLHPNGSRRCRTCRQAARSAYRVEHGK